MLPFIKIIVITLHRLGKFKKYGINGITQDYLRKNLHF